MGLLTPRDNLVPYPDHALFLAARGADLDAVIQAFWHYRHPVDLESVRRFHANFGHGLMGRRIERSPLPFGRLRWIASPGPQCDLDIAGSTRPPAELFDFADEQLGLPLDPESGPAWRLAVQPFTDGSTAVILTISHCLGDATAAFAGIREAIGGRARDLGYPEPSARSRVRALRSDLAQTIRETPEIVRIIRKATKIAITRGRQLAAPRPPERSAPGTGSDRVRVPSAMIAIDADDWDSSAAGRGGNSFSLVAGFAVKLAERLGRTHADDGSVTLMIPVSQRDDPGDTGGNVVSIARVSVNPVPIATDLSAARAEISLAIRKAGEAPDELVELLPLVPFVPQRAFGRLADMAFGFSADVPVSCTNVGELPTELLSLDGTAAESWWARGMDRHLTREALERRSGLLTVASARLQGKVILVVTSYQPGGDNSPAGLREVIAATLNDFDLTGAMR